MFWGISKLQIITYIVFLQPNITNGKESVNFWTHTDNTHTFDIESIIEWFKNIEKVCCITCTKKICARLLHICAVLTWQCLCWTNAMHGRCKTIFISAPLTETTSSTEDIRGHMMWTMGYKAHYTLGPGAAQKHITAIGEWFTVLLKKSLAAYWDSDINAFKIKALQIRHSITT